MKKTVYVLCSDLDNTGFDCTAYSNLEDAQKEMMECFNDCKEYHNFNDDDCGVDEMSAYIDCCGDVYSWWIEEKEIQ